MSLKTLQVSLLVFGLALISLVRVASAQDEPLDDWPREIDVPTGQVVIYQPQPDALEGTKLKARAAVSYTKTGEEPIFGAAWFEANLDINRDERLAHVLDVSVTELRVADGTDYLEAFDNVVKKEFADADLTLSLDNLVATLDAADVERERSENLATTPPVIVFKKSPAILVLIDGEPVLREVEGSPYKAVINTPYPLILDTKSKRYHLNPATDVWYAAQDLKGPYTFDSSTPKDIKKLVEMDERDKEQEQDVAAETKNADEKITASNAPEIVIATEPTELIVAEGEPDFAPLVDDLLVMSNTENYVFMHVSAQEYYVVLSGRWYKSKSMNGPWSFVKSDALPEAFQNIPENQKSSDALVYVAGTEEAEDATLDAQIPQTAQVDLGPAPDLKVEYDGDPKFEKIEETDLQYATNTGDSVIVSNNQYYTVRDAVWYTSSSPTGPWHVSDHAPEGVEGIPASNPTYNTKYVYVYQATPTVVYTGYTPGYMGSYVYGPTVVYGTGYYYRPWVSPYYYYPRHSTWGFHVNYNPWTGWGFGLSWSSGPFRFGFYSGGGWHHHHGWYGGVGYGHGWYGAGGYRRSYSSFNVRNNVNINVNNFNRTVNRNNVYRNNTQIANVRQTRNINNRSVRNTSINRGDLQNRAGNVDRNQARQRAQNVDRNQARQRAQNVDRSQVQQKARTARDNNVFADRDGTVKRKAADGSWQERSGKQWKPSTGTSYGARDRASRPSSSRPSTRQAPSRTRQAPSRPSGLNRQSSARSRGASRTQSFNRARGGGGARAGGRRR